MQLDKDVRCGVGGGKRRGGWGGGGRGGGRVRGGFGRDWAVAETSSVSSPRTRRAALPASSQEDGWTALHFAARHGYASFVEALLPKLDAAGVDAVAKDGKTPLRLALQ
eukprot:COSAG06_NODE_44946_length_359_cov_0.561538_1_plen_108_part_10